MGARQALARAEALPDVARLVDYGEAAKVAAKRAGLAEESQRAWAAFSLDAQRKAGELLRDMPKASPGPPSQLSVAGTNNRRVPTIPEVLATDTPTKAYDRSKNWQDVAAVPEATFREYVDAPAEQVPEPTRAGLLKHAETSAGIAWADRQGMSTREIGAVLGVSKDTVARDMPAVSDETADRELAAVEPARALAAAVRPPLSWDDAVGRWPFLADVPAADRKAALVGARQALARAEALPDVARLVDYGEAAKVAAKRAGLAEESQRAWAAFSLDAQRKAGELLQRAGRRSFGPPLHVPVDLAAMPELDHEHE